MSRTRYGLAPLYRKLCAAQVGVSTDCPSPRVRLNRCRPRPRHQSEDALPEGMNLHRQVSCDPTFAAKASAGRLVVADSTTDAEGPGHAVPPTNCASWSVPYPRRTGLALLSRLPTPGDLFAWGMCLQIAPLTEGGMVLAATGPAQYLTIISSLG